MERDHVDTPPLITIPEDNRVLFFDRDREVFGFLSNFHEAPVTIDGETWRSTEFYYQAQKSFEPEYRDAIRGAKNSNHAKGLATDPRKSKRNRKRSWFTDRIECIRADWDEIKLGIMEIAVRAKFTQNADLKAMLIATGNAEIVEDSTFDPFWGIGRDGLGQNAMGKMLMKIRDELNGVAYANTFSV